MYEYRAQVLRVVDGDTIHAEVDLGFDTYERFTFRLAAIDAPELSTPEGKAARQHLEELIGSGTVIVTTIKDKREKYGRYLAYITAGATRVNDAMIADGHAKPYDGGKR